MKINENLCHALAHPFANAFKYPNNSLLRFTIVRLALVIFTFGIGTFFANRQLTSSQPATTSNPELKSCMKVTPKVQKKTVRFKLEMNTERKHFIPDDNRMLPYKYEKERLESEKTSGMTTEFAMKIITNKRQQRM